MHMYVWSWMSMIESEKCVRASARMSHQTHLHTRMNTTPRAQVHTRMNLHCCVRIRTNAYAYGTVDSTVASAHGATMLRRQIQGRNPSTQQKPDLETDKECMHAKLQSWKKYRWVRILQKSCFMPGNVRKRAHTGYLEAALADAPNRSMASLTERGWLMTM
jgi:hypothetical protein